MYFCVLFIFILDHSFQILVFFIEHSQNFCLSLLLTLKFVLSSFLFLQQVANSLRKTLYLVLEMGEISLLLIKFMDL